MDFKRFASFFVMISAVSLFFVSCGDDKEKDLKTIHDNETISVAETWSGVHIVKGTLSVNAALTIAPCTVIEMDPDAKISVFDDGALKSIGTEECPVIITSGKTVKMPGDWNNIEIFNTASSDSEITWTVLEFGGDDYGVLWNGVDAAVKVTNTVFKNIAKTAAVFDQGSVIKGFSGNSFSSIGGYLIELDPDNVKDLDVVVSSEPLTSKVFVHEGTVLNAGTWKNLSVPYIVDTLHINASMTVQEGTVIKLNPGMKISIFDNGELIINGTEANRVTITSSKTTPAAGDWDQIEIFNTASNASKLTYTDIMYGGGADYGQLWIGIEVGIILDHVIFSNGKTCDIANENEGMEFTDSEYIACAKE